MLPFRDTECDLLCCVILTTTTLNNSGAPAERENLVFFWFRTSPVMKAFPLMLQLRNDHFLKR